MIEQIKGTQLKTKSRAHVVIRNAAGFNLFDMYINGAFITVTTAFSAEIEVDPDPGPENQDGRCGKDMKLQPQPEPTHIKISTK